MGAFSFASCSLLVSLILITTIQCTLADVTIPYLNPGFSFSYDKPNQRLSLPITSQCEQIQVKWGRTGNDTGPSPVAPYFLQIFNSEANTPFLVEAGFGSSFSWQVPFAPGTQYQICMYDYKGVSGGCQSMYTMIANTTTSGNSTVKPSCPTPQAPQNVAVEARVPTGLMAEYGYIDQCHSLSVKPQSGLPPYTLTVAPSSHPPFNISSNTLDPINWEVQLPVGTRFFLSLETGDGLKWAAGPLRVGGNGPMDCLAPNTLRKSDADKTLIGASVGGCVLGLLFGILGCIVFTHLRRKWQRRRAPSKAYANSEYYFGRDSPDRPLQNTTPAPSVMFSSKYTPSTRTPTLASMPVSHAPSRHNNIRLEPVRAGRIPPSLNRHESMLTTTTGTDSIGTHTDSFGTRTDFASLPSSPPSEFDTFTDPFASSGIVMEDTASQSSSNAHSYYRAQTRRRPPSGLTMLTQAPSYRGPDPDNVHGGVYVIPEIAPVDSDTPPEYGNHVGDTSFGPPGTTPQAPQELMGGGLPPTSEESVHEHPLVPSRF